MSGFHSTTLWWRIKIAIPYLSNWKIGAQLSGLAHGSHDRLFVGSCVLWDSSLRCVTAGMSAVLRRSSTAVAEWLCVGPLSRGHPMRKTSHGNRRRHSQGRRTDWRTPLLPQTPTSTTARCRTSSSSTVSQDIQIPVSPAQYHPPVFKSVCETASACAAYYGVEVGRRNDYSVVCGVQAYKIRWNRILEISSVSLQIN